jgi:hypothetical protein
MQHDRRFLVCGSTGNYNFDKREKRKERENRKEKKK